MRFFRSQPRAEPSLPEGYRIYAVGDVHGCLDLFQELLDAIQTDNARRAPAQTIVILLGDLIDRGPDSAGVVRHAMAHRDWAQLLALKGNHESAMLDALGGDPRMLSVWLNNGGVNAIKSWGVEPREIKSLDAEEVVELLREAIPAEQRTWLSQCPLNFRLGDFYFVHAGVRPGVQLADQSEYDNLWIREEFLTSRRDHGAVVVHGHSPVDGMEELHNRIGLDTGAYLTGRLTAVGLEGTSRWRLETSPKNYLAAIAAE
jgi:serine/threonine protein phosphatase 1